MSACCTMRGRRLKSKKGYPTVRVADKAMRRMAGRWGKNPDDFNAYRCPDCGKAHFGHRIKGRKQPMNYLTAPKAAVRAGVSQDTIRRACEGGKLPARKLYGQWAIDPAALDAWKDEYHSAAAKATRRIERAAALKRARERRTNG